jgi:hypothetical protein
MESRRGGLNARLNDRNMPQSMQRKIAPQISRVTTNLVSKNGPSIGESFPTPLPIHSAKPMAHQKVLTKPSASPIPQCAVLVIWLGCRTPSVSGESQPPLSHVLKVI